MTSMSNLFLYIVVSQVIVGPQKYSQVYDVLEKVAAAKSAPLISVSRSLINCKTGILFTRSGHPFQLCDLAIQNPPGVGFGASNKVTAVYVLS